MKISIQKIAEILSCKTTSSLEVSSYAIDSRKIEKGGIFFALPGERVHGESFLEEAANKGAFAACVSKSYTGFSYGLILFYVDDVLESLQFLAKSMIKEHKLKVIAITGSVGKTSTKEMIYHMLSSKYRVSTTEKNYNTQRMLPICILMADALSDFLVLEMAMTKPGQIQKLANMAPPEIVVLTEITYCHSENFSSLEDIAQAKVEIFHPGTKFAVIHRNSAKFDAVYQKCISDHALYPEKIPVLSPYSYTPFNENFTAAYLVCKHLGMSDNQITIAAMLLTTKTNPHRFEKKEISGVTFIDDSYNANVLSVNAALKNLPEPKENGRKIFVFGEMKELGGASATCHAIVAKVALDHVDEALCIGYHTKALVEEFSKNNKKATYFHDIASLRDALMNVIRKGDVVLLKGSKLFMLWKLLTYAREKSLK